MKLENVTILPIWGEVIPGNSTRSKLEDMHPDDSLTDMDIFTKYPGVWDKTTEEIGDMRGNDTTVWREEIQEGYAEETYTDVPFLVPYLVPGSERCVIACPGGAYLSKSMQPEGADIAAFLNEAGISCFVLWYRSYPYRVPTMFWDLQRAIRFVRFHAAAYGIDPEKIATVGFSAGGNLVGVDAFCFRDEPVEAEGYVPDEIDAVNACPNGVGMIYPAITLEDDKALGCIIGKEAYNDPAVRATYAQKYEMMSRVQKGDAPVFLCNAMDDEVLPSLIAAELAGILHEKGVDTELHIFPCGGHGFGGCVEYPNPFGFQVDYSAVRQWKSLFVNWLERIF